MAHIRYAMGTFTAGAVLLAALGAGTAPAAAATARPLTSAQVKAALITPKNLGGGFTGRYITAGLQPFSTVPYRKRNCTTALAAFDRAFAGARPSVVLTNKVGEVITEGVATGGAKKITAMATAARNLTRWCHGAKTATAGKTYTLTRRSIGKLGQAAYAFRLTTRQQNLTVTNDFVVIRYRDAIATVWRTSFAKAERWKLTVTAAKKAAAKLKAAYRR